MVKGVTIGKRVVKTTTELETEAFGYDIGRNALPRSIVVLNGNLGAGKTVLARGIAKGLNIEAWRGSPTFALVHEYEGRLPMFHMDAYRLEPSEVEELDIPRMLECQGVLVVEWGGKVLDHLTPHHPSKVLRLSLVDQGGDQREIVVEE